MPAVSPDGRRIAYQVRLRGAKADIFVMNGDGSTEQLTSNPAPELMPSWPPDGRSLVYASLRNGSNHLWKLSLTDGSEKRLSDVALANTMARLSPDGKQAVYHVFEEARLATYRLTLATGVIRRLTPESESMGYPFWTRDGKWVVVERTAGDGTEVGVIPAEGGTYRSITAQRGQNWPYSSSPDGTRMMMAALRDGAWNLWWVGLDGSERRLTDYRSLRTFVRYPDWSPTGDRVVFEFAEAKGNIFLLDLPRGK
jgi:TolB protein